MTAPSFTYSGNVYTGAAAGTVDFALTSTTGNPIAYLEPSHIHVYKSSNQGSTWTELTRPAQWDFVTSGTVARLVTGIAAGDWVKVQRITPSSPAYVTFQSSSLLTAEQLNDDTLFNTYLNQERSDQGDQSTLTANNASTAAASATATANAATTTANTALSTANTALSTANTASSNASAAVTTANTASTNASAAVTTANTASTNASAAVATANTASTNASSAVTTANTAASDASTALSTANTALSTANTALSTANTASTNASAAVTTANTASTNASNAVTTANTASTNATNAVNTANTASTNASNAVTTANTAISTANAAASAVASAILYDIVANVAAIPGSPANNDAVEVTDSTGIESFTPLAGVPGGFVGSSGLSVRLVYTTSGSTWNWIQYFPNDPESRYLKLSGGTLTGQLRADDSTSVASPVIAFDGDTNTGVAHTGADELALVTGGSARLTIDGSGNVAVPGTLGVTGAITGSLTGSASLNVLKAGDTMTGNLTAPALIPSGSTVPTNGVYLPAANSVAISTGGSGRLFVNSDGNVSLGATTNDAVGSTSTLTIDRAAGNGQLSVAANGTVRGRIFADNSTSELRIGNPTANALMLFTNNTERLRITSAGLVGIGTSSVDGMLHVKGANTHGSLILEAGGTSGSTNQIYIQGHNNAGVAIGEIAFDETATNQGGLSFKTNGGSLTTKMTLTSGGSLGIGTTGPTSVVHAYRSTAADVYFRSQNSLAASVLGTASTGETFVYNDSAYPILFFTNGSERCRVDSSGRLLVGTSSASYSTTVKLQGNSASSTGESRIRLCRGTASPANGDTLAILGFSDNTETPSAEIAAQRDGGTWSASSVPGRLVFSTTADGASSPTERMRITNNGYLKIANDNSYTGIDTNAHGVRQGTGNNWTWMTVSDTANPFGINISFPGAAPNNTTNLFMRCQDSGTARLDIRSNGGLANYQANDVNLSDINSKKDITPAAGTWDCIKEWEIVNYRYKDQPDDADLNLGVIAQQVAESCPEVITVFSEATEDQPEKLGVKEQQMYWMAIKALQEAQVRIEALEAEVVALKAQ